MKDTRRRLAELAGQLEPSLARAFLEAIRDIQSEAQLALLVEAIEAGRVDDAIRILQIRPETFGALDDALRAAFLQGAAYQIDSVRGKLIDPGTGARLLVRFGGSQPRAQEIVTAMGARLVTGLVEGQREQIAAVITDGLSEGKGAKAIALDLVGRIGASGRREGGVIGLTERDARTVQRVRTAFLTGDVERMKAYLGLKSRNKRFDGIVKRAIRDGKKLSAADTARITGHLADRFLRRRGENIARTETIPALNSGRREAIAQLIDRGAITEGQVRRVWDATGDARTRLDHMVMEGQTVRWNQPFTFPDGSRAMGPGDNSLGASADQIINCRCYEELRIDFLAGAV